MAEPEHPPAPSPVKRWDVFVSYAREDEEVVAALTRMLLRAGVQVWVDQRELKVGDSLRSMIDEGLASSRFGVVVLSPSFLAKRWPEQELSALFAMEVAGTQVILPVWHEVDAATVAAAIPLLADRVAVNTSDGLDVVARAILDRVFDPTSGSPSQSAPSVLRKVVQSVEEGSVDIVADFLAAHTDIVRRALSIRPGSEPVVARAASEHCPQVDLVAITPGHYQPWRFELFLLGLDAPDGLIFDETGSFRREVEDRLQQLLRIRDSMLYSALGEALGVVLGAEDPIPDLTPAVAPALTLYAPYSKESLGHYGANRSFGERLRVDNVAGAVVRGRRSQVAAPLVARLRDFNEGSEIGLRTYDWLLDAASHSQ